MMTDEEAIALREVLLERAQEQMDGPRTVEDDEVYNFGVNQLAEYEKAARAQKRIPFQQMPEVSISNLEKLEAQLDKTNGVFEDSFLDNQKNITETVAAAYFASRLNKSPDDIWDEMPIYKKALQDRHQTDNFHSALKLELQTIREGKTLVRDTYDHAYNAAMGQGSMVENMQAFMEGKEGVTEDVMAFYDEAFNETRALVEANKDTLETFRKRVEGQITGDREAGNYMDTVNMLMEMPPELQTLAMSYADNTIGEDGNVMRVFRNRVEEMVRQFGKATPREMMRVAREVERAVIEDRDLVMSSYAPVLSPEIFGDRKPSFFPFFRTNDVERAKMYEETRKFAKVAQAMSTIDNYVTGQVMSEGEFDSKTLNWIAEKIVYPTSRMAPDIAVFTLSSLSGAGMAKNIGMVGRVTAGKLSVEASTLAGHLAATATMAQSIKHEHYNKLMAENANMDPEQAYLISDTSGYVAASLESLSMGFVVGRLPVLRDLMKKWRGANFRTPAVAGAATFGGVMTVETATELAQDYTASLTQEVFAAIDADIPDANLGEAFIDTIKQAPDIALAILPLALIGGGHTGYVNAAAQRELVSNRERLANIGMTPEQVDSIFAEEGTDARIAKFQEHFDLPKALDALNKARAEGKELSEIVTAEELKAIQEVQAAQMERDDPAVFYEREDNGEISNITITTPDGKEVDVQTQEQVVAFMERWYQENPEPKRFFQPIEERFTPEQRKTFDTQTLEMVQFLEAASTAQGRELVVDARAKTIGTFQELEQEGLISAEEVDAAVAYIEAQGGKATGRVFGVSSAEIRQNIVRESINLFEGANVETLLEEKAETWIKGSITNGEISEGDLASALLENAKDPAKRKQLLQVIQGDAAKRSTFLYEEFAALAKDFAIGKLSESNTTLPKGLQDFLSGIKQFAQAVIRRAVGLKVSDNQGMTEGLQDMLARSVGLDTQTVQRVEALMQSEGMVAGIDTKSLPRSAQRIIKSFSAESVRRDLTDQEQQLIQEELQAELEKEGITLSKAEVEAMTRADVEVFSKAEEILFAHELQQDLTGEGFLSDYQLGQLRERVKRDKRDEKRRRNERAAKAAQQNKATLKEEELKRRIQLERLKQDIIARSRFNAYRNIATEKALVASTKSPKRLQDLLSTLKTPEAKKRAEEKLRRLLRDRIQEIAKTFDVNYKMAQAGAKRMTMPATYVEAMRQYLTTVNLGKPKDFKEQKEQFARVMAQAEENPAIMETDEFRMLFAASMRPSVSDPNISVEHLTQVLQDLQQIRQTGRTKAEEIAEARKQEMAEILATTTEQVRQQNAKAGRDKAGSVKATKQPGKAESVAWQLMKPETLATMATGDRDSALYRNVVEPIYEGWAKFNINISKVTDNVKNLMSANKLKPNDFHGNLGEIGGRMMTMNEAMFVYAHSQNERGKLHLGNTEFGTQKLDEETVARIVGLLPKPFKAFVDGILDYHDNVVYPRLNTVFLDKFGVPLPKEDKYFPIRNLERGTNSMTDFYADYSNMVMFNNGFLKGRKNSDAAFSAMDFMGDFTRNAINVETTLALQDNALKAARVLNDKDLQKQLRGWSEQGNIQLKRWLQQAATGKYDQDHQSAMVKVMTALRRNASASFIALNIASLLKVPASVPLALNDMSYGALAKSALTLMANPMGTVRRIGELSEQMKVRFDGQTIQREFNEFANSDVGKGIFGDRSLFEQFKIASFVPMQVIDTTISAMVWNGKYMQSLNEGATEAEAIRKADRLVADSQQTGRLEQMAHMYRSGELNKILTMFTQDINNALNIGVQKYAAGELKGAAKKAFFGINTIVLPALILAFSDYARDKLYIALGLMDEVEDDETERRFAADAARYGVSQVTGSLPLVGRAFEAMTAKIATELLDVDDPAAYFLSRYEMMIAMAGLQEATSGAFMAGGELLKEVKGEEADPERIQRGLEDIAKGSMIMKGVPATPLIDRIYQNHIKGDDE